MTVVAVLLCYLAVEAQNYDRYYFFHDEAVKLKNEGKLDVSRDKFKKIKEICKGGIPPDNDLDKMIRECTTLGVSESVLQFDAMGGLSKNVTVRTNADAFRVSSGSDWCKAWKKGNVITVSCEMNSSPSPRETHVLVVVESKTVSIGVSQRGGQFEFELKPDSVSFSKSSETVRISISTNALTWHVESVPDWVECQTNDTVLLLKSEPNRMAVVREATLYVAAMDEKFPIYVRQAESDTVFSFSKEELVLPYSETEEFIKVESNCGKWGASSSNDWIEVSAGYDMVLVRVRQNESSFSRHGKIRIGAGSRMFEVPVYQYAYTSKQPILKPEIEDDESVNHGSIMVKSIPSDLKVTITNDIGESIVRYTPFDIPVDYSHYSLKMGFEQRELFTNEQYEDILFKPGLRFASITWSPRTSVGFMSGFVGANSWGAYAHFSANKPYVKSYNDTDEGLSGYDMTFGPVFRPNQYPYVGAYAGIGGGAYAGSPHYGLAYEAGIMGFYKNLMLSMGFKTSRLNSSVKNTSFTLGFGGYLKRYYDSSLGYCASDSRRWISLNYVSRPAENGKGLMIGDLGRKKLRSYIKAMYLLPPTGNDSLVIRTFEGSAGILLTPVNGLIDIALGASVLVNKDGLGKTIQGVGAELGAILNVWRFPITVMLHESDISSGNRHLSVDFGIGFHLGEFKKIKCSYQ